MYKISNLKYYVRKMTTPSHKVECVQATDGLFITTVTLRNRYFPQDISFKFTLTKEELERLEINDMISVIDSRLRLDIPDNLE